MLPAAYNSFWLANRRDGIYSGGKVIIASHSSQGNHIGQEADLQARWNPGRHTLVDLAFGRFFARPAGGRRTTVSYWA
jgi:cytochrome c5